jgi:hypothetical protein
VGRGGHRFREHWHRRSFELDDGRTLTWVAMLDRQPGRVECFAVDGQPVHPAVGGRLLDACGHPDADLRRPSETALMLAVPGARHAVNEPSQVRRDQAT